MSTADVLPPHDGPTEAGALACILGANTGEGAPMLCELADADFYDHRHRTIYSALVAMRDAGKPLDMASLYLWLRDADRLDEAGGLDYLQRLPDATPSPASWPSWLEGVRAYRQRRADLAESVRLRSRALDGAQTEAASDGDDAELARLATLPALEYERQREDAANKLGCRTSILDKLVDARRAKTETEDSELHGRTVNLPDVELWPDAVDGMDVLSEVADRLTRYVALPPCAADALALWCAHTHCFDLFMCMPRLHVTSPEKGCGKTTLRDVLALFVRRPLPAENLSVAVLFRVIQAHRPTVLADECDSWLRDNDELRGMLNSGHRRGGQALRCEGESNEVRAFNVFAPAVLCGIGALPGTLHDRSIVIRLERAKPGEVRERFDSRRVERETELRRKLARFVADHRAALEHCDPALPSGAFNRIADNWRPLFAIAEIAGGDWPRRTAVAFAKLTAKEDVDAQGIGAMLLADIADLFATTGADRLASAEIVKALAEMEGRPWAEWGRAHKPISTNQLANQLRRFGVSPHAIRVSAPGTDKDTPRGYLRADFAEAFDRYLPKPPVPECNSATTIENIDDSRISGTQHSKSVLHRENARLPHEHAACCGVAVQEPPTEEREAEVLLL